jgi:hypothetical protein
MGCGSPAGAPPIYRIGRLSEDDELAQTLDLRLPGDLIGGSVGISPWTRHSPISGPNCFIVGLPLPATAME